MKRSSVVFFAVLLGTIGYTHSVFSDDEDPRHLVAMPEPMKQHMLSNMRDHLLSLTEIQQALASGAFEDAANIAEKRIGMSSLAAHGALHMAPFMPKEMQNIGTEMHKAASRFAVIAQNAAATGDMKAPLDALSKVTQQCVACHASFRIH